MIDWQSSGSVLLDQAELQRLHAHPLRRRPQAPAQRELQSLARIVVVSRIEPTTHVDHLVAVWPPTAVVVALLLAVALLQLAALAPSAQVLHKNSCQCLNDRRAYASDAKKDEQQDARRGPEHLAKVGEGRGNGAHERFQKDRRGTFGSLAKAQGAKVGRVARVSGVAKPHELCVLCALLGHGRVRLGDAHDDARHRKCGEYQAYECQCPLRRRVLCKRRAVAQRAHSHGAHRARPARKKGARTCVHAFTGHLLAGEKDHTEHGTSRVPRKHPLGVDVQARKAHVLHDREQTIVRRVRFVRVTPRRRQKGDERVADPHEDERVQERLVIVALRRAPEVDKQQQQADARQRPRGDPGDLRDRG